MYLQGLLPSLDILCVSCSPTVTSTCTCAGPTTPTCRGRSTPKTQPRVSSWVLVSLQHEESTSYCTFFVIQCRLNDRVLSRLRSSSFPQVTSAPSWWSTKRRCTSPQTVGRHGDRYVTSSCARRSLALQTFLGLEVAPLTVRCRFCVRFLRRSITSFTSTTAA